VATEFERVLLADASEVARRTLRHKFGRLSNNRILRVLRKAALEDPAAALLGDAALLDRWFAVYDEELLRLRRERAEQSRNAR
jgi:hypothetical protein